MTEVDSYKYLGVTINNKGEIPDNLNDVKIKDTFDKIAASMHWRYGSPAGRAITAKSLLSSKLNHLLTHRPPSEEVNLDIIKYIQKVIWFTNKTDENPSGRIQIARSRMDQPIKFGGLSIQSPRDISEVQQFTWLRKLNKTFSSETNYGIALNICLAATGCPTLDETLKCGPKFMRQVALKVGQILPSWEFTLMSFAQIQENMCQINPSLWPHEYIIGHKLDPGQGSLVNIYGQASLRRSLLNSNLTAVGQFFHCDEAGLILPTRTKTLNEINNEFQLNLTPNQYMCIEVLLNLIKTSIRNNTERPPRPEDTLTNELMRRQPKGCSLIMSAKLAIKRRAWPQGNVAPSYQTFTNDQLMCVDQETFTRAFQKVNKSKCYPGERWTSWTILLRTLWTNEKYYKSKLQAGQDPTPQDKLCELCLLETESTAHLMTGCWLSRKIWGLVEGVIAQIQGVFPCNTKLGREHVIYHKNIGLTPEWEDFIQNLIIKLKHKIYRARFEEDPPSLPQAKRYVDSSLNSLNYIWQHFRNGSPLIQELIDSLP